MTIKHWLMLVLIAVGAFVYQYPNMAKDVAHEAGIGDGSACGAVQNYLQAAGNDNPSKLSQYKFAGDKPSPWLDNLDDVESASCTCTETVDEMPEKKLQNAGLPEQVENLTTAKLVLFNLSGRYKGSDASMEGGAIVFQPATPGWFVSQEGFYRLNGEDADNLNVGQLAQNCSIA